MRSAVALASPARTSSTICSMVNPCAIMIASVQPSGMQQAIRARGGEWREECAGPRLS